MERKPPKKAPLVRKGEIVVEKNDTVYHEIMELRIDRLHLPDVIVVRKIGDPVSKQFCFTRAEYSKVFRKLTRDEYMDIRSRLVGKRGWKALFPSYQNTAVH